MQFKKKHINDKILEAGREEYLDKGYRAGNISTIANNAGVPVGNLYRYFDGKSGLLDAIVKPAYVEIPKIVSGIASKFNVNDGLTESFIDVVVEELKKLFAVYGKEILILVDKSATSRYDDFEEKIAELTKNIIVKKLFPNATEYDETISDVLAKSFLNAIYGILRLNFDAETMEKAIKQVVKFFFFGAKNRV